MKNKQIDRELLVEILSTLLKNFIGGIAIFLIFFGIHWIAIVAGVTLGIVYYFIPKKY